jgi:hypothetical protein
VESAFLPSSSLFRFSFLFPFLFPLSLTLSLALALTPPLYVNVYVRVYEYVNEYEYEYVQCTAREADSSLVPVRSLPREPGGCKMKP